MSNSKKSKLTLASKLRSKVDILGPVKKEAELKLELLTDIKNIRNAKSTTNSNANTEAGQKNLRKKKSVICVEKQEDDNCAVEPKKLRRTTRTNKVKEVETDDPLKVEAEVNKTSKTNNISKATKQMKTSLKCETNDGTVEDGPSCSKDIKEEQVWEPPNWQQLLDNIRIMRSKDNAPVDNMGCHKCADDSADEKTQRYHKLVALMLSSQTKDETTYHAMLRLREHTLTPESICDMKVTVLENILHPVSFYKNKAKYLQKTSKILVERYHSDIPNNIKELVALPGVGPKMAHICMATAWHETTGIGVDVHVHRICNRLQWLPKPTKDPEQTRVALERWLARPLWGEVNHLLVGFGQTTCTPLKPKCTECLNNAICPSSTAKVEKKPKEKLKNAKLKNICDESKFKKTKMHL